MTKIEVIDVPTIERTVKIDKATRKKLLKQFKEESQVIIHCSCTGTMHGDKIRIWKSTFLYVKDSKHKSKSVYVENITMYPTWIYVDKGQTVNFTLIFTGLPKDCKQFDLIENIPEPGGFIIKDIERNNADVYLLDLT